MLDFVSLSSVPLNGLAPDNKMYANTPMDQMSVCGYAGSSANTSGAKEKKMSKKLIIVPNLKI